MIGGIKLDCILTATEILCIAANLGATELYGIPDAFKGIGKTALQMEILKIQSSLEKKGYLSENFDGDIKLDDKIADVIYICAYCDKFISIDKQLKNKAQEGFIYYIKGSNAIKATKLQDKEYKFKSMDASLIKSDIQELFIWSESNDNNDENFTISTSLLSKAKTLKKRNASEAAEKVLTDTGIQKLTAKVVINGLNSDENFYSFTTVDLTSDNDYINNVMFINSPDKSFELLSDIEGNEDVIKFQGITHEYALKALNEIIDKININGGVFE